MYWYRAEFLAEEAPELQIAGGWEEALGKLQPCCVLGLLLLLGTIDKKPTVVSYMLTFSTFFPPPGTSNMVIQYTQFFYSCIRKVE